MALFCDIYGVIKAFKKYLFGIAVAAYIVMTVGIPVYLHYCGGELEEVSYLTKADSCCGGEDDHSKENDGGCCEDEGLLLKSNTDFTLKEFNTYKIFHLWGDFCISLLPSNPVSPETKLVFTNKNYSIPPGKLYSSLIISTSVLRI